MLESVRGILATTCFTIGLGTLIILYHQPHSKISAQGGNTVLHFDFLILLA